MAHSLVIFDCDGVLVDSEVELYGLEPADDSLENVFTYLVDQ